MQNLEDVEVLKIAVCDVGGQDPVHLRTCLVFKDGAVVQQACAHVNTHTCEHKNKDKDSKRGVSGPSATDSVLYCQWPCAIHSWLLLGDCVVAKEDA